jgi:linoleoyl-CoA desaturase
MSQKPKVRFTNKDKSKFFSTLRTNVYDYFTENNISKHANTGMVLKTIILMGVYFVPYALMLIFHVPNLLLFAFFLLMGTGMAGIGMSIMHDANHNAYSSNATVNKWVGYSLNLMGGAVFNWKLQHNLLHHTYTNINGMDDDIDGASMMRFSPHRPYRKIFRFQHFYAFFFYAILSLHWITGKDFLQLFAYRKNGVNRESKTGFYKQLATLVWIKGFYYFYMLFIPIYFFHYAALPFILAFVSLHVVCGLILSVVFQLAHTVEGTTFPVPNDSSEIENDWAIHQMNTTADFARDNSFVNWYVGGLNFQVEHHLFPDICHVHYRAISDIVKQTAEEFDIPYLDNPTFWGAVGSHVQILKYFGSSADAGLVLDQAPA